MDAIVSKRALSYYLNLIIPPIPLSLLGVFIIFAGQEDSENSGMLFFSGAALIAFCFYHCYRYIKGCPTIAVNQKEISFNGYPYFWTEIAEVRLTDKKPFRYFDRQMMPATTIVLTDGATHSFYDGFYSNTWEIKQFIETQILPQKAMVRPAATPFSPMLASADAVLDMDLDVPQTFAGQQWRSWHALTMWVFLAFSLYFPLRRWETYGADDLVFLLPMMGLLVGFFVFNNLKLRYFQVSDHFLTVRTHNLLFLKKRFRLSDIQRVILEPNRNGNMPDVLRIVFQDFKQKEYPAGTFNKKLWLALKERLEHAGIPVQDDLNA